ncbi:aldehyde dehydrogenase family protein [Azohydromonas australica]|uniref:aldehyde dehydrogenase family protein n=1 Tax=Azohydromonas australica TaxID=364039 RepID=UPI000406E2D7|nr:aldehyde dehydrogenase family protein [Azohydromonas australica]
MNMLKETSHPSQIAVHTDLLINNQDRVGEGELLRVVNPATEELVAEFPGASVAQVDEAVTCAKAAFDGGIWRDPQFRRATLLKFAALIEENRDQLMDTLVSEVGTPINLKANHIDTPVAFLRWFADAATRDRTRHLGFNVTNTAVSMVAYRPVGVVAAITAFNYPILIGATKIGAALAAGCTTVLMSSPQAPLTVALLGDLVRRAGFPPGVVNILAGGAEAGRALTEHPGVAKVSFTGSVNVGRQVMQQAAAGLRSVVLELGGKSAAIMLPGVDFNKYAFQLHARYARNAGQGCGSPTRILVEESRYEEFVEISRKVYPQLKVGYPRDPATVLGPVITAAQRERIEAGVARAVAAGATLLAGGGRPDIERGWFVNPALVGGLDNQAALAREEIFGPVSVVLTYRTVEEAVHIANDSDLGLKAYLFGAKDQCLKLVPELRVGTVQINGGSPLRPDAPMIGYKHSGVGAEWGEDGLREFMLPQHIDCPLA